MYRDRTSMQSDEHRCCVMEAAQVLVNMLFQPNLQRTRPQSICSPSLNLSFARFCTHAWIQPLHIVLSSLLTSLDIASFRFLNLPREIRDKIYGILLCIFLRSESITRGTMLSKKDFSPSILHANKQIYAKSYDAIIKGN